MSSRRAKKGDSQGSGIKYINSSGEYVKKVKECEEQEQLLLIEYTASWCGPCKAMEPFLEDLGRKYGSKLCVRKIDVDNEDCDSVMEVGNAPVKTVPQFALIWNGSECAHVRGAKEGQLARTVSDCLRDIWGR